MALRKSAWLAAALMLGSMGAEAAPLQDPPAVASRDGQLNLILTAKAQRVELGGRATTAWVYEVCRRASAQATSCLPGTRAAPYGGVRLKLGKDDRLNIRLVNRLPPVPEADHCAENPALAGNPTNLHTHGLIVEPHRSTGPGDPYGDYVFLELRNPANGKARCRAKAPATAHAHGPAHPDMDVLTGAVEYRIDLRNHPSGLFWFHPHMHGLSLNQVTSGMAGAITVGEPEDECRADPACRAAIAGARHRILVLKDSEVLADGRLLHQQDASFCDASRAKGEPPRRGRCAGIGEFKGGQWIHTINGQRYPEIAVGSGGDLWRIVNAAGSRSYDLSVEPIDGGAAIPLQIMALDGITLDATTADMAKLQEEVGEKARLFHCQGDAICTRHLRMMPASRVTVRVLNDGAGPRNAVLRTAVFATGGDDWPAIDLASVTLAPASATPPPAARGEVAAVQSPAGPLGHEAHVRLHDLPDPVPVSRAQDHAATRPPHQPAPGQATEFAIDPALKLGLRQDPTCRNLAAGERRRIYFGNPHPGTDGFGLATSVIGADGTERDLTAMRVFDPRTTNICLVAAPAGVPVVVEDWELVNLTDEDHNFHVHQTRFWLRPADAMQPAKPGEAVVLQDNLPLPRAADAAGCDGSIAAFHAGGCKPAIVHIAIPFTEIGDFVFHCHILEHEDGGMMARIRVVAPPYKPVAAR